MKNLVVGTILLASAATLWFVVGGYCFEMHTFKIWHAPFQVATWLLVGASADRIVIAWNQRRKIAAVTSPEPIRV